MKKEIDQIRDGQIQRELENMIFSEDLLSTMGFEKRELTEDLACLATGSVAVYSLGKNIYFFEETLGGYRFKQGISLE